MNVGRYANWITGISLGIGLLVVLNQLQIPYYLFYPRATQTILISASYDYYLFLISTVSVPWIFASWRKRFSIAVSLGTLSVWAISFILAIANEPFAATILYATVICATVLRVFRSDSRRGTLNEIILVAFVIFLLIEWSSVCYWVVTALNPHTSGGILSQEREADLTFCLYPLEIPMMLLLLFSWLWIPLVSRLSRAKTHLVVRYRPSRQKLDLRIIVAALDLFAIVALIVFFYPYLAGQTWVVGQDTYLRYVDPVNSLVGLSASQAFGTSATHGVYVGLLYLVQLATGVNSALIVKYAPLVLAFCTASAVFFVVLRGGWGLQLAILTSLCTLLWLPTTLGIYVAIQANWIAFLFWMIFLSIYFANSQANKRTYVILALLSFLILLFHPWTWGVFVTTLLFTAIVSRGSSWAKHCIRTLVAALVIALPLGLGAYFLSPSLRYDLANTIHFYLSGPLNPASLLTFVDALANMFYILGPAVSPALLLLSLVGAYALCRRRALTAKYLVAWAIAWCIGSILIAPTGLNPTNPGVSETGLWRMLYISPLPFLLALGMETCIRIPKRSIISGNSASITAGFLSGPSMVPFLAAGSALFIFWDANVRLLIVAGALIVALLLIVKSPGRQGFEAIIALVLVLLLFNAAFRTLFPLVLDPHNIFASLPTGR